MATKTGFTVFSSLVLKVLMHENSSKIRIMKYYLLVHFDYNYFRYKDLTANSYLTEQYLISMKAKFNLHKSSR